MFVFYARLSALPPYYSTVTQGFTLACPVSIAGGWIIPAFQASKYRMKSYNVIFFFLPNKKLGRASEWQWFWHTTYDS